jgi:hypothetical protein
MDEAETDKGSTDEERGADSKSEWTILHFSLSNPTGPDQGNVAKLLRRAADEVEALGDVQIGDMTFSSQPTAGEDDLTLTFYFHRHPRRR